MNEIVTLALLAFVFLALVALRQGLTRVVVSEHEAVLLTRNGKALGRLAPGVHRFFLGTTELARFDLREALTRVAGQEVPTRDGVAVKFAVLVRYKVVDAPLAARVVTDLAGHVHAEAQLALREVVHGFALTELLEARRRVSELVASSLKARLVRLGVELLDAVVQDVMLPGELKRAFGETVRARAEACAKLERARGETATLRKLANAARLLREHEGLERLRVLEIAERAAAGEGNTLVLGLEPGKGLTRAG
jgi:regulator of protease activity HflC (stomatin/prohibitin superfamily)